MWGKHVGETEASHEEPYFTKQPKCANCQKDHTADSKEYEKWKETRKLFKINKYDKYIPTQKKGGVWKPLPPGKICKDS